MIKPKIKIKVAAMKKTKILRRPIIVQRWEESERGWGVRPDGYSIHSNKIDRDQFVKDYWDRMPDDPPDEYSRPSGLPYVWWCDDEESLEKLKLSKNGAWGIGKNPPGLSGEYEWVRA